MKLSIIIPVYNVDRYLRDCLDSCLQQDLPADKYEIIVVNDGSDDDSLAICQSYEKNHPNLHLFTQANAGLSYTRNRGLDKAKGKYIWFVDADDRVRPFVLKDLVKQCEQNNLDVLQFTVADHEQSPESTVEKTIQSQAVTITKQELLGHRYNSCVWTYLFKKALLDKNRLRFMEGVYHEDEEWTPRVLYLSERIGYLKETCYYVTKREGSITRSINPKKAYDLLLVTRSLSMFVRQAVSKSHQPFFHRRIALLINSALHNAVQMDDNEKVAFRHALSENLDLLLHLHKCGKPKYVLEGWLFRMFPSRIPEVYKWLQKIKKCC